MVDMAGHATGLGGHSLSVSQKQLANAFGAQQGFASRLELQQAFSGFGDMLSGLPERVKEKVNLSFFDELRNEIDSWLNI